MPLPGIEVFIMSVHVRSESFCKKTGIQVNCYYVFLHPGSYYAGFMSLFVASELIIVICFLLDHSVFYRAIMGH